MPKPLTLGDETWGDRLHRAYREARRRSNGRRDPTTGRATFSYVAVAERLTAAGIPVGDSALLRLEEHRAVPMQKRTRRLAYFTIIAYGYDPADFELPAGSVDLSGYDMAAITRALSVIRS